jgi:hypothetical protein
MINLEYILLKLVSELSTSEFKKAVKEAGLSEVEAQIILDTLDERGV